MRWRDEAVTSFASVPHHARTGHVFIGDTEFPVSNSQLCLNGIQLFVSTGTFFGKELGLVRGEYRSYTERYSIRSWPYGNLYVIV